jgi:hypothetical protein
MEVDLDNHVLVPDRTERFHLPGPVGDRKTLDPPGKFRGNRMRNSAEQRK